MNLRFLDFAVPETCSAGDKRHEEVHALKIWRNGFTQARITQKFFLQQLAHKSAHALKAAKPTARVVIFYTSSASEIYPEHLQTDANAKPLRQE